MDTWMNEEQEELYYLQGYLTDEQICGLDEFNNDLPDEDD